MFVTREQQCSSVCVVDHFLSKAHLLFKFKLILFNDNGPRCLLTIADFTFLMRKCLEKTPPTRADAERYIV